MTTHHIQRIIEIDGHEYTLYIGYEFLKGYDGDEVCPPEADKVTIIKANIYDKMGDPTSLLGLEEFIVGLEGDVLEGLYNE